MEGWFHRANVCVCDHLAIWLVNSVSIRRMSRKPASASWSPFCFSKLLGGWNLQSHETSYSTTPPPRLAGSQAVSPWLNSYPWASSLRNIDKYLKLEAEGLEGFFTGQILCIVALICWVFDGGQGGPDFCQVSCFRFHKNMYGNGIQ